MEPECFRSRIQVGYTNEEPALLLSGRLVFFFYLDKQPDGQADAKDEQDKKEGHDSILSLGSDGGKMILERLQVQEAYMVSDEHKKDQTGDQQ